MSKRLLFIVVVVLVVSSAATAGPWGWLWGIVFPIPNPSGQTQITYVTGVNGVVNQGTSERTGTYTGTQTSPQGTQSSQVTVSQNSTVTGSSPGSFGGAFSTVNVVTVQYQQY